MKNWIYKKLPKVPFKVKMFVAKLLLNMLADLENDILLYNELKLWIDTNGRPLTSNPNYIINKTNEQKL